MKRANTRILSGVSLGAMSFLLASQASAQTQPPPPPQPVNIDENSVDVSSRSLVLGRTDLRIGPDDHRGLKLNRQLARYGWRLSSTPVMSGNSTDPIVVVGGRSFSFHWNGSAYVPTVQDGSTLNSTATQFTASDGTVVQFQLVQELSEHATAFKAAQKITFPDGVEHTFSYQTGWYEVVQPNPENNYFVEMTRLISINSSTGYQLKLSYASNISTQWSWRQLTKVTSINNAVEFCSPSANTCSLTGDWPQVTYGGSLFNTPSVTDPEGRATTYTYSGNKVASITPPGSGNSPVSFTYSGDQVLTVSKGGGTWTYSAPFSTVTQVDDPNANYVYYIRNSQGFITNRTVSRNGGNDVTAFDYCTGTSTCPVGRVQKITSPEQNYTVFAYDARGNMTSQTHHPKPNTGLTPITRSASYPASCTNLKTCNKPTSVTDAGGNVTNLTWNGTHGGLVKVEAPAPTAGAARPTTIIDYGQIQARYLTAAGVWSNSPPIHVFNAAADCRTAATCAGSAHQRIIDFNYPVATVANNGLPAEIVRKTGDNSIHQSTSLTYSELGDVASINGPLSGTGDQSVVFYNRARQQTGVLGPDDPTYPNLGQRVSYDAAGRAWKVESGHASGQTAAALAGMTVTGSTTTTFDSHGRPIKQAAIGSDGSTYSMVQTSYDSLSRRTCVTQRMNPASFASLPSDACVLASQGSFGPDRIAKYAYDELDRVTKLTQGYATANAADAYTVTFTANGRLASAKDAENNLTTYLYDGHDRNYQVRFPVATKGANASSSTDYEQYGFDANGNVTSFRTRRGETLILGYDNLDRLTSKIVPERSGLSSTHTRDVYYAYDLFGGLTAARYDGPTGEGIIFAYDGLGRVISESLVMDGVTRTVASAYDTGNNRTALTYPDNQTFSYTYGIGGRPELLKDPSATILVDFNYDPTGRVNRIDRYGSANDQYFDYDALSRMSALSVGPSSTSPVNTWSFTHNPGSQIATSAKTNDAFAWDAHADVTRSYTSNGLNQYTSAGPASFTYDANGNLASDGTSSFVYDVENRLVYRSGGGTSATVRYDPLGRLYEVNGSQTGITRFFYDGDALIAEYNAAGVMLQRHVHGPAAGLDAPLVNYSGSSAALANARFLYADERGSIVYRADSAGASAAINSYDSYGIPGSGNIGRFQYTGQAWVPELGMYYYKARMYSPTLGRFMQTDPIGYGDGMNWYNYVGGDPVNRIDPSGLSWSCFTWTEVPRGKVTVGGGADSDEIVVTGQVQGNQVTECAWVDDGLVGITTQHLDGPPIVVTGEPESDEEEEEGDIWDCLGNAGKAFVDGALEPEAAALALGAAAWHAANRTAPEDYRPLTNDERAQARNRGTLRRSFGSALRIGAKRAIPGYLAVSAAVGAINAAVTAANDPTCRIK